MVAASWMEAGGTAALCDCAERRKRGWRRLDKLRVVQADGWRWGRDLANGGLGGDEVDDLAI